MFFQVSFNVPLMEAALSNKLLFISLLVSLEFFISLQKYMNQSSYVSLSSTQSSPLSNSPSVIYLLSVSTSFHISLISVSSLPWNFLFSNVLPAITTHFLSVGLLSPSNYFRLPFPRSTPPPSPNLPLLLLPYWLGMWLHPYICIYHSPPSYFFLHLLPILHTIYSVLFCAFKNLLYGIFGRQFNSSKFQIVNLI